MAEIPALTESDLEVGAGLFISRLSEIIESESDIADFWIFLRRHQTRSRYGPGLSVRRKPSSRKNAPA